MQNWLRTGTTCAVIANGLIFSILVYATLLFEYDSDHYYLAVQEDEYLEWTTFWAFLIAAALSIVAAVRQRRSGQGLPWFLTGVALFCLFVALEEISWGQRLLGYRPPVYFLDQNFQQEFNIHNVVDTRYRKLALKAVIIGYGVILPLLQLVPASGRLLTRLGVIAPPIGLLPTFLATYVLYDVVPVEPHRGMGRTLPGTGFSLCCAGCHATLSSGDHRCCQCARTCTPVTSDMCRGHRTGIGDCNRRQAATAGASGQRRCSQIRIERPAGGFRKRAGTASLQPAQAPVHLRPGI